MFMYNEFCPLLHVCFAYLVKGRCQNDENMKLWQVMQKHNQIVVLVLLIVKKQEWLKTDVFWGCSCILKFSCTCFVISWLLVFCVYTSGVPLRISVPSVFDGFLSATSSLCTPQWPPGHFRARRLYKPKGGSGKTYPWQVSSLTSRCV